LKKLKIIMTGGGSAGHVTPNLALVPKLKELGYEIQYIGTRDGIERKIIKGENLKYHVISSGKLRRYFDVKNFTDPFRVVKGVFDAIKIIHKEKPNIVFSKGGFVSVPVVLGAKFNKVPVIIHESDITPGLANKISVPYCTKVCVTFPEALAHFNKNKVVLTGSPIRAELFQGNRREGLKILGFSGEKPVLLIIGGSLGAKVLNENIRNEIESFTEKYEVVHICGKGNLDTNLINWEGYKQFEYVDKDLTHILAASDLVISRAGSNAIFEFLALRKPNLLVPLSSKSSRGDQILNAKSFEKSGYSMVLPQEQLKQGVLLSKVNELYNNSDKYINKMNSSGASGAVDDIIKLIKKYSR
jgi:UDP-N-acetylglucosamine--N-acetylmuramyl-(pentapeptide) pyrophosphoryl-undecaprenol N-acetylglucosamine transferase